MLRINKYSKHINEFTKRLSHTAVVIYVCVLRQAAVILFIQLPVSAMSRVPHGSSWGNAIISLHRSSVCRGCSYYLLGQEHVMLLAKDSVLPQSGLDAASW